MSLDDGDHWQSLQLNLPHTSMRDLWVQDNDLIVATHGRSFWILDDISPLRQLDKVPSLQNAFLFQPGGAYRVRRSTNSDTPLPADEPMGENPPDGAAIDYLLPASVTGPVTLEILDSNRELVRRYASDDTPEATAEELNKQLIPLYWLRIPKVLPAGSGMHRWIWDMHYSRPVAAHYEYPIAAVPHDTPREPQGPLALPGTYTARLTANGRSLTAPFTLKMDPRVRASSDDLAALFSLQTRLAKMLTNTSTASMQAHSAREQLDKLPKQANPALARAIASLEKNLGDLLDGPKAQDAGTKEMDAKGEPQAGLDDITGEAGGLYTEVGRGDARPTSAQYDATEATEAKLSKSLEQWERLKATNIPAMNRLLRAGHLTELNLGLKPETMPEGGDED